MGKLIDNLMIWGLGLIVLVVVAQGTAALSELNDGRVASVVASLQGGK